MSERSSMTCIGKGGQYFDVNDNRIPCSLGGYLLRGMWCGGGDGWICAKHAAMHVARWPNSEKSWLTEKILESKGSGTLTTRP